MAKKAISRLELETILAGYPALLQILHNMQHIHNYLGRLRKKLGDYGELLETVPGMGYNLHSKKKEDHELNA